MSLQFLLSILSALGVLALTLYVIRQNARTRGTERKTMKEIDDLDQAVAAINSETTALGERVTEIQQELADALANNDASRLQSATAKLSAISAALHAMAQPAQSGSGVVVSDGGGSNGVIIGGDAGGGSGVSATGATPVNQPPGQSSGAKPSGVVVSDGAAGDESGSTGSTGGGSQ